MPRKLTENTKAKRAKKAKRKIEEAKDLPQNLKHAMIEGLYRIGWSAQKIISETGLPQMSVYRGIERFESGRLTRDASIKPKTIAWARKYGSSSAEKKFKVAKETIKDWMKGNWGH